MRVRDAKYKEILITKETPTEEILGMLIQVNDELNKLNYKENESQYNYLETKRRILEDIVLIKRRNKEWIKE